MEHNKATLHIVTVENKFTCEMNEEEEQAVVDDITKMIISGEIVVPGLKRGDAVQVKEKDEDIEWNLGEELYFFDGSKLLMQTRLVGGNGGEMPEELYWPEFPIN